MSTVKSPLHVSEYFDFCFAGFLKVSELSINEDEKDAVARYRKLTDNILNPLR